MLSGNSSVGRAQPCQGWGRGFKSRFPLHFFINRPNWRHSQVAKARVCKTQIPGSNPGAASKATCLFAGVAELVDARDLKSLGSFSRVGSIPTLGTIKKLVTKLISMVIEVDFSSTFKNYRTSGKFFNSH